jgi:plasmid stability protein
MSALTISMADEELAWLRRRATAHGRSVEAEATAILRQALQSVGADPCAETNALWERLAASGRTFSDSTELLREDRER